MNWSDALTGRISILIRQCFALVELVVVPIEIFLIWATLLTAIFFRWGCSMSSQPIDTGTESPNKHS